MSEFSYNEKYFEKIDNEHKAYWLGFLYADGYVETIYRRDKIKAFRIEIGLSEIDRSLLEMFAKDIETDARVSNKTNIINGKEYRSCRLRVNNTKMCRDLIALGCATKKSLTLLFPTCEIVPQEHLRHFIRGYFDGDGCVHYRERSVIDSRNNKKYNRTDLLVAIVGTKDFLNGISNILKEEGVNFRFNKYGHCGKSFEIRLNKRSELHSFYNYLYTDATIFLNRKKAKFDLVFSN